MDVIQIHDLSTVGERSTRSNEKECSAASNTKKLIQKIRAWRKVGKQP